MFISPSVYLTKCFLSKLCSLGTLPQIFSCGGRPPVVSAPAAQASPAARLLWLLWLLGCSGCSVAQLLWLLWLPARLLRLSACPLWLLAFIPYAKVKKLILTHYILFIWKDRCMFFSDAAFPSRLPFSLVPMDLPGISISATAQPLATEPRPAAPPQRSSQQLCHGVPASNKPHQAEKSTPVWLAIWRIWAGFANSQHRDAAFATPDNICVHSSLLPH